MRTINIKPVEIIGNCRANLTLDDEFQVDGVRLINPRQSNICLGALSHLVPIVQQLQRETRCFAHAICPDCLSPVEPETRAVFLLGHADKWELCQALSAYDRWCGECQEPDLARRLKEEAIQHQRRDEYSKAVEKMQAALEELKRVMKVRCNALA